MDADNSSRPAHPCPLGFTARWIETFKPAAPRYEVGDLHPASRGLRLRFESTGPVFRWYVTEAKGRRIITIGPWHATGKAGHMTLAQARQWLAKLKEGHRSGTLDAVAADLAGWLAYGRPARAAEGAGAIVKSIADEWYRDMVAPMRATHFKVRRVLDLVILPSIGHLPLVSVTPKHLCDIIEAVIRRGATTHAGTILSLTKQLFQWADGRGYFTANGIAHRNPASVLSARAFRITNRKRQRFASDDEVRALWAALADAQREHRVRPVTAMALRLLLLVGLRSGELRKAKWSHVNWDEATLTVPPQHRKMRTEERRFARAWVVPLSKPALEILRALKAEAGDAPYVLAGDAEASGKLGDGTLPVAMGRLCKDGHLDLPGGALRPHDLRRTMRTGLSRLGVPREVAERCLDHVIPGVEGIYNQDDFLAERRKALELWSDRVMAIVEGREATVVPLRKAV